MQKSISYLVVSISQVARSLCANRHTFVTIMTAAFLIPIRDWIYFPKGCGPTWKVLGLWAMCSLCSVKLAVGQKSNSHTLLEPDSERKSAILEKFSRYRHYTMADGLSSNDIRCMVQDDDGFLWLGTQEGLNRFDGERFVTFFAEKGAGFLPNDGITKLLSLPDHRVLVGTEEGLCLVHTRRLQIIPIDLLETAQLPKNQLSVSALFRSRNGAIWVGTAAGIFVLDGQCKPMRHYDLDKSQTTLTMQFLEMPNGTVIFGVRSSEGRGAFVWQTIDPKSQKPVSLSALLPKYALLDSLKNPNCIVFQTPERAFATPMKNSATNRPNPVNLYRFDFSPTAQAVPLLLNPNIGRETGKHGQLALPYLLPDSLLLLQRYFGNVLVYDLRTKTSLDLPTWSSSFPDGSALAIFVDGDNQIWLAPRGMGVYFLPFKTLPATPMSALNQVHQNMMKKTGVSGEWFRFVGKNIAGRWLLGSPSGGLYNMDKMGKGIQGPIWSNLFNAHAYVGDLVPFRGDTCWMSTLEGLCWYKTGNNTHGKIQAHYRGLDSLDGRFLFRDAYGLIWGRVRNNGVCCVDTRTGKLTHFPSQGHNAPFPLQSATGCGAAPNGDLWFCFAGETKQLVHWHRKTGVFEAVTPRCPPGVACAKAFSIAPASNNKLFAFNADQRWYIMDTRTGEMSLFGKPNGLITNNITGICFDRDSNLWAATPHGLSRWNPGMQNLRTFYELDGLLSNIVHNVELIDTAQNILCVSTARGLCLFEPNKITKTPPAPPVFVTQLMASDVRIQLPASSLLSFPHHQNNLRIEFTGANFLNGPNGLYQYSLVAQGNEPQWKNTGTDNFANFLNLAPGQYDFRARTANSDGVWGLSEARLSISIRPSWWQTWVFRVFLISALCCLAWVSYRWQIRRVENRAKEQTQMRQQLADLEMKALRSQMNPHFVFNALNSIQDFVLSNDTREASRYLTKFARLMRLILENSESPIVPLDREIELLRYYTELESLRFDHRFSFSFHIDPDLNPAVVQIPGMLIQPHIENAIWHGLMHKKERGQLWVRFLKLDNKTIVCEIEDDGVGRAQAANLEKNRPTKHRSTGLSNIKSRLDLLKTQMGSDIPLHFEDLYTPDGSPSGTKVTVQIPLTLDMGS